MLAALLQVVRKWDSAQGFCSEGWTQGLGPLDRGSLGASPRPPHLRGHSTSEHHRYPTLLRLRMRKKSFAFCWETRTPSSAVTQLSHARQSLRNILASANLWNSPFYKRRCFGLTL